MRQLLICFALFLGSSCFSQKNDHISTIDFVQVLDNNDDEAIFYFQNNWKILRDMALKKEFIHSYQFLQVPEKEGDTFEIILITTYNSKKQYKQREVHFQELIKEKGALVLLNDKKPNEFRKTQFSKKNVKHWN